MKEEKKRFSIDKEKTIKATITTTETTKDRARKVSQALIYQENISGLFTFLVNREYDKLNKK